MFLSLALTLTVTLSLTLTVPCVLQMMRTYTGDQTSSIAKAMAKCDPLGPLMINVVKLYSTPDGESFSALGRVYSGAVRTGQKVKVSWLRLVRSPVGWEMMACLK